MNFLRNRLMGWSSTRHRPVATPTVVSLAFTSLLLGLLLLLPDRADDRQATAAELSVIQLDPATPSRKISFRDMLITGLQARLKSEVAFVDAVIEEVEAGRLPKRLVDQTFFWARQRAGVPSRWRRPRRPIIYFQPAMVARAARIGVHF